MTEEMTGPGPVVREIRCDEFPLADEAWREYHGIKGDPEIDRIFGVFVKGRLVSLARCIRHPDGREVDGVFTPPELRGRGYANLAMGALVEACHTDPLYMYAVSGLEGFYGRFGFAKIGEPELPAGVRARYLSAKGNMEGSEVQPMWRPAGLDRLYLTG
ncbi:MAG: GNAT family N-acetyltransferase [Methanoregulaceae archaeon]